MSTFIFRKMNTKNFERLIESFVMEEKKLLITKGKEYTINNEDKLHNFKSIASKIGISPLQVWAVYFTKHSDSILNYIKQNGKVQSNETIQSRIVDARNYLLLLAGLIEDEKQ